MFQVNVRKHKKCLLETKTYFLNLLLGNEIDVDKRKLVSKNNFFLKFGHESP